MFVIGLIWLTIFCKRRLLAKSEKNSCIEEENLVISTAITVPIIHCQYSFYTKIWQDLAYQYLLGSGLAHIISGLNILAILAPPQTSLSVRDGLLINQV